MVRARASRIDTRSVLPDAAISTVLSTDASSTDAAATANHAALVVVILVVAWLIVRQLTARRLDPRSTLAWVLLAVGAAETLAYLTGAHVTARDVALLVVSAAVGGALAVVRARTVRLWRADGRVLRQGTPTTAVLWLVSIGQHLLIDTWSGDRALANVTLLAHFGFALLVQNLVLVARARELGLLVGGPDSPRVPRR